MERLQCNHWRVRESKLAANWSCFWTRYQRFWPMIRTNWSRIWTSSKHIASSLLKWSTNHRWQRIKFVKSLDIIWHVENVHTHASAWRELGTGNVEPRAFVENLTTTQTCSLATMNSADILWTRISWENLSWFLVWLVETNPRLIACSSHAQLVMRYKRSLQACSMRPRPKDSLK